MKQDTESYCKAVPGIACEALYQDCKSVAQTGGGDG